MEPSSAGTFFSLLLSRQISRRLGMGARLPFSTDLIWLKLRPSLKESPTEKGQHEVVEWTLTLFDLNCFVICDM